MKYKLNSYSNKCGDLINILQLYNPKNILKWQILNSRNIQNLIINYIGFTPKNREELNEAVKLWCNNKKEAKRKYGDINTWNVQNITDMSKLFQFCSKFNDNINNWDVSNVTNMSGMLSCCNKFNQPLNNWDVSNVKNMNFIFQFCKKLSFNPKWYKYYI